MRRGWPGSKFEPMTMAAAWLHFMQIHASKFREIILSSCGGSFRGHECPYQMQRIKDCAGEQPRGELSPGEILSTTIAK